MDNEENHNGFKDIMVYTKEYPSNCFDPRKVFNLDGSFKHNYGPFPEIPPIQKLIQANKKYEARRNKDSIKVIIPKKEETQEFVMDLISCPICRRLVPNGRFKMHYAACVEKEKKELEEEKKKKEIKKNEKMARI